MKILPSKNELRIAIFTSLTLIIISSALMMVGKAIMMSGWHDRDYENFRMMRNAMEDEMANDLDDESMDSTEPEAGM